MLLPKRVKRRRVMRGKMKGKAMRGTKIAYGDFGLVAASPAWVKSNQIEAARIAMTRYIKRGGKVWIKIFPDKPVTEKPAETRMGSGKGSPEYWVAVVKPGRVLFEISGVPEDTAREAMRLAMHKLPLKCKFVTRAEQEKEAAKAAEVEAQKAAVAKVKAPAKTEKTPVKKAAPKKTKVEEVVTEAVKAAEVVIEEAAVEKTPAKKPKAEKVVVEEVSPTEVVEEGDHK